MTSPAIVLADQMPFVGHLQQRQIDGGERDAVAVGQLPVDRDAVAGLQPAGFDLADQIGFHPGGTANFRIFGRCRHLNFPGPFTVIATFYKV